MMVPINKVDDINTRLIKGDATMNIRLLFLVVCFCLSSFLLSARNVQAVYYSWSSITDFKGIDQYNLFLKGDLEYFRSDVEGRAAIGGNVNMKGFSIGVKADKSSYSLVVGGDLNAGGMGNSEGGQVNNGGIYAGGETLLKRVGLPEGDITVGSDLEMQHMTVEKGSVTAKGDVKLIYADVKNDVTAGGKVLLDNSTVHGQINENAQVNVQPPVDFVDISLSNISSSILSNGSNSNYRDENGLLVLECTDPLVCYFNVSKDQLENAWGVKINAPSDKTVVINVDNSGQTVSDMTIDNMAFNLLGGIRSTNILYNFFGFNKIEMYHVGIMGSILAPEASIDFHDGNLEGVLMAQNLYGGSWDGGIQGGQIDLPTDPTSPTRVPEPSVLFLLVIGLGTAVASYRMKGGG